MSSTFSNLKFELIGNGEQSGQWGTTTNSNIGTAIEQAIVGMATLDSGDFTTNVCTLTLTNLSPPVAQDARALCLNIAAGAVSAAGTINVPAIQKPYIVINGSSFAVTVKVSGQTGVAVPAGTRTVVYNNGTDVGAQVSWLNALTLGTALPVASGGSGGTTASAARTNFGATTLGGNLFTITNPSAVTFPRFNADNTVSALDAAAFRTAIGVGTGTGTVTSVAVSGGTTGLTTTGGPITSSGTITLTGTLAAANGGTGATTLTGLTIPQAVLAQPVITQNVQVIGTDTTAVSSRIYVLTASLTLTLPASPSAGNTVTVSNMSGAVTATIARNSQPIMALAEDLTVDLDGAGFTLIYSDATRGWVLLP
jgi:hypothetical protein